MIYPLRDENCDTGITFDLSRWKQARGKIKISSKPQFSVTLAAYSLRVENFLRMTPQTASPSGNKWRNIQNRGKKTGFSLATLWKGNFLKAPRQMAFLTGNKWREKIPSKPQFSVTLAAYPLGDQIFFWKHLLKRPLPVGISREKKFSTGP